MLFIHYFTLYTQTPIKHLHYNTRGVRQRDKNRQLQLAVSRKKTQTITYYHALLLEDLKKNKSD